MKIEHRRLLVEKSVKFLIKSIDKKTLGSRAFYSRILYPLSGWSKPYPETTGYIIKTFDDLIFDFGYTHLESHSETMAQWLLSIQMNDGAFPGGLYDEKKSSSKSIFNTAQIIIGLCSRYKRTNNVVYLNSAKKAANWIIKSINTEGAFAKYHYVENFSPSYYTRVCWPLLEVYDLTKDTNISTFASNALEYIAKKQLKNSFIKDSGFKPESHAFLHTIAYTIRGFLESYLITKNELHLNIAIELAEKLLLKFERKKYLAGAYFENFNEHNSYRCLTGESQIAIIWFKLYKITNDLRYLNAGIKLLDMVSNDLVGSYNILFTSGGHTGSKPFYGKYIAFRQPNWASKFYLDAIMQEEIALNHFKK